MVVFRLLQILTFRGCLYRGELALAPELARFAKMISSCVYIRRQAGSLKQTTVLTAISSNISHEPEIRTFVSIFRDYNPQNRSLTHFMIDDILLDCYIPFCINNQSDSPRFMDYPRALDSSPEDRGLGVRDWVENMKPFVSSLSTQLTTRPKQNIMKTLFTRS